MPLDPNDPIQAAAQARMQYLEGQSARAAPAPVAPPPSTPTGGTPPYEPPQAFGMDFGREFSPSPPSPTPSPEQVQANRRSALTTAGELGGMALGGASPIPGGAALGAGAGAVAGQRAADYLVGGAPADPASRDLGEAARAAATTYGVGKVVDYGASMINIAKGVANSLRAAAPEATAIAKGAPISTEVTEGIAQAQQAMQKEAFDTFNNLVTKVGSPEGASQVADRIAAQAGMDFNQNVVPHVTKVVDALKTADKAGPVLNAVPLKEAAAKILADTPEHALSGKGREILEEIATMNVDKMPASFALGTIQGVRDAVRNGEISKSLAPGIEDFGKAAWSAIANSKDPAVAPLRDAYKGYLKATNEFERSASKMGISKEGGSASAIEIRDQIKKADTPALISELKQKLDPSDAQALAANYLQDGFKATVKDGKIDPAAFDRFARRPQTEAWLQGSRTTVEDLRELGRNLPVSDVRVTPQVSKAVEANGLSPKMSDQEKMASLSRLFEEGQKRGYTPEQLAAAVLNKNFGVVAQNPGIISYLRGAIQRGTPSGRAASGAALVAEEEAMR